MFLEGQKSSSPLHIRNDTHALEYLQELILERTKRRKLSKSRIVIDEGDSGLAMVDIQIGETALVPSTGRLNGLLQNHFLRGLFRIIIDLLMK